METIVKEIKQ